MRALLGLSEGIRRVLEVIALIGGWLLVAMAAVTCFDVILRKMGVPLPSTKLQELEWHFHAAIFSLWMGYCYTINAHPRVDSFTEAMTYRGRAWIEFFGARVSKLFGKGYQVERSGFPFDFILFQFAGKIGGERQSGFDRQTSRGF